MGQFHSSRVRAMIKNGLIGDVPETPAEAAAQWRQLRTRIHDAFASARTSPQREDLLALNQSLMKLVEQGLDPQDLESFREIRGHSYTMLVVRECLVDDRVDPQLAQAVVQRELASGRMATNHPLRDLKQMVAFARHMQRTLAMAQRLAPRPQGPLPRLLGWLLQ
jgi:hypothetical protein